MTPSTSNPTVTSWKANATDSTKIPCIGVSTGAFSSSASATILLHGIARDDSWTWTVGGIVYLSTSGGLTQTQPSATNNVIQVIGVATASNLIYVRPLSADYMTYV